MAVPPTIPTSFVPHPGSGDARRSSTDFTGAFGFFAYFVFALVAFSAFAVFGYERFLAASRTNTDQELQRAAAALNPSAVTTIVRLRDRLLVGERLLNNHVALSNFFVAIESVLPKNVRFTEMRIGVEEGRTTFTAEGVAKTFNALAAMSDVLAKDGRIKNAIFSNIGVAQEGGVTFSLNASLDPLLVAFSVPAAPSTEDDSLTTTP